MQRPLIIQGGMGAWVSGYQMAQAVSMHEKCMGTISGTALDRIIAWYLQHGDPGGYILRALEYFPYKKVAERVVDKYYINNKTKCDVAVVPKISLNPHSDFIDLTICGNFAVVWLAKQSHTNPISINYLEKIQVPLVYSILGVMLAGVDCITIGAGIPNQIPSVFESIITGKEVKYAIDIVGRKEKYPLIFNPKEYFNQELPELKCPEFLPIISSNSLSKILLKNNTKKPFGFVVERPSAGGHNAPPRGYKGGEYNYGKRDEIDYNELNELDVPYWIAGSYATPEKIAEALAIGACGVQVGSIFALSDESEIDINLKYILRRNGYNNERKNITSNFSPTGYPFKVEKVSGTLSDDGVFEEEYLTHKCDKGFLVSFVADGEGNICSRCPAEPLTSYLKKGGKVEDTTKKRCICNGLLVTVEKGDEGRHAIITLGEDLSFLRKLMSNPEDSYSVDDVIKYLLRQ